MIDYYKMNMNTLNLGLTDNVNNIFRIFLDPWNRHIIYTISPRFHKWKLKIVLISINAIKLAHVFDSIQKMKVL